MLDWRKILSDTDECLLSASLTMECVPVAYPGAKRPVSFVFLLGGNYTGQNNFLFPPHLSVGSVSPVNSFTQIVLGKDPLHSSLLLD